MSLNNEILKIGNQKSKFNDVFDQFIKYNINAIEFKEKNNFFKHSLIACFENTTKLIKLESN